MQKVDLSLELINIKGFCHDVLLTNKKQPRQTSVNLPAVHRMSAQPYFLARLERVNAVLLLQGSVVSQ